MIWEAALATGRDVDLLCTLFQMHLGGSSVSALDIDSGESRKVGDEVAFAELVNLLLNWNNFKRAEILGGLKLLHVQCSKARVVKIS